MWRKSHILSLANVFVDYAGKLDDCNSLSLFVFLSPFLTLGHTGIFDGHNNIPNKTQYER